MYKDPNKHESNNNSYKPYTNQFAFSSGFSKFLPSSSTEVNLVEIGFTLDKIYDFIIQPVQEKLPQYMDETQYADKKQKMEN